MNLIIVGKKAKTSIKLEGTLTVLDLKKEYSKVSKKNIHRISFKFKNGEKEVRLDDDSKSLDSLGLKNDTEIIFKDLGQQIGYRLVFVLEYLGPIIFVLLYYLRPSFIYGQVVSKEYNWVAQLAVVGWVLHFLKREFETFFVHKFSRPTMPLSNLFKNCAYYWSFGAFIGYPLCSPSFSPPSDVQVYVGAVLFVLAEVGNLICHLKLSNMRTSEGSQERSIPKGFLFEYVACPNYTFEVLSWIAFSIATQLFFSYAFTVVGFLQMADWAMKKHRNYKKTFDKEYTKLKRKAIVPFLY
jgi:very-long-chain enoyl-CoA reductase